MKEKVLWRRFDVEESVFRLNVERWKEENLVRTIIAAIEEARQDFEWVLGTHRTPRGIVVEHLFPADQYLETLTSQARKNSRLIDTIPTVYPIEFDFLQGYLRLNFPLARQFGVLHSDFLDAFEMWFLDPEEDNVWQHGFQECGGAGHIPRDVYNTFDPDEEIIDFFTMDVNINTIKKSQVFFTDHGIRVFYRDGRCLSLDKVDFLKVDIPSGIFSFNAFKGSIVLPGSPKPVKLDLSPSNMNELDAAREVVAMMLQAPPQGRSLRQFSPITLPFLRVSDTAKGPVARSKEAQYRSGASATESIPKENPFQEALRNPFTASSEQTPGTDYLNENPFG